MNAAQKAARKLRGASENGYYVTESGVCFRLHAANGVSLAKLGVVHVAGVGEVHEALRQIRESMQLGNRDATGVERVAKTNAALESVKRELADPAKAVAFYEDLAAWFVAGCDAFAEAPEGMAPGRHSLAPRELEFGECRWTLTPSEEDTESEIPVLSVLRLDVLDVARMGGIVLELGGLVDQLRPFRSAA